MMFEFVRQISSQSLFSSTEPPSLLSEDCQSHEEDEDDNSILLPPTSKQSTGDKPKPDDVSPFGVLVRQLSFTKFLSGSSSSLSAPPSPSDQAEKPNSSLLDNNVEEYDSEEEKEDPDLLLCGTTTGNASPLCPKDGTIDNTSTTATTKKSHSGHKKKKKHSSKRVPSRTISTDTQVTAESSTATITPEDDAEGLEYDNVDDLERPRGPTVHFCRRFSLEHQLPKHQHHHEEEEHSPNLFRSDEDKSEYELSRRDRLLDDISDFDLSSASFSLPCTKGVPVKKELKFDMQRTQLHPGPKMSLEEWDQVWYTRAERCAMEKETHKVVQELLKAHQQETRKKKKAEAKEKELSSSKKGHHHNHHRHHKKPHIHTEKAGFLSSLSWRGPICTVDPVECLKMVWKPAQRAKTEKGMAKACEFMPKEDLEDLYEQPNIAAVSTVVGLEALLLQPRRGTSLEMVRFIITRWIQEKPHPSQDTAESNREAEKLLAKISQSISRPSRILAHELAVAQAKALK